MSFISYAQNCEDVMLWRVLGHVAQGFYIDVGANHPADDSVTKAFYDRGWSGINIEPLPEHAAQLRAERPRDINVQVAIGAENGEIDLFDTPVRGLATASADVAKRHDSRGLAVSVHRVPLRRLADICQEHAPKDIHFLKIDVEGLETEVLKGMDFQRFRPWVVVVEATLPNSREVNAAWEPMLLDAGYLYVYFDGLNRFYLASEQQALQPAFATPPNVFDDFVAVERVRIQQRQEQAEAELATVRDEAAKHQTLSQALAARAVAAEGQALALQQELQVLRSSSSWRITRPLRGAMVALRRVKQRLRRKASTPLSPPPPMQPAPKGTARFDFTALPRSPLPLQEQAASAEGGQEQTWVRITGHIEGHYSLAIVNRGLALALEGLSPGRVRFVPCHHQPYANPQDLPATERPRLLSLIGRSIPPAAAAQVLSIVHHYPLVSDSEEAGRRLAIFFWEETAIPADMIGHINQHFDGVMVASQFVKRALINSGCRLPLFIIPMGIDRIIDPAVALANPLLRDGSRLLQGLLGLASLPGPDLPVIADLRPGYFKPFRFLHVSSVFERKGVDLLLAAYFSQFTGADPVELVIKTFPNPHNTVGAQLQALQAAHGHPPRVIIDESDLDDAAMAGLYRSAQVLVLPTRGEGFNLPAAEAMALGLPVITTGHGAQVDFCTEQTATLLPFRFARSISHLKSPEACWVEPEQQALALQLRALFHRVMARDAGLEARRHAAARHVRNTYRWRHGARAVRCSAAWLAAKGEALTEVKRSRVALLSPWATRCGVGEYSQGLFGALLESPDYVLEVFCDQRTTAAQAAAAPGHCTPCWQSGDAASVLAVLQGMNQSRYDVVVVQHQPSLFRLDDAICQSLVDLQAGGAVVIVELHSTQQLLFEHRLSERSLVLLRRLDRIVVHQLDDLNNLLALGLVDNVMLLPLGVVQPLPDQPELAPAHIRAEQGIAPDELVLASFGFVFPHKGIDTLVQSIAPLAAATGRPVRLLCVNSTPNADSEQTLRQYQELARQLGVADRVIWVDDFLPIAECQRLLAMADYVAFPYKETRESASAAVTVGLATGKPVLVSPLHIFADLDAVTYRLDGADADAIVRAVVELEAAPERARALVAGQQAWLAQRSTAGLSARFESIIQALRINRLQQGQPAPLQSAETVMRQLLVDVSELYFRDARTGIQRVVRSILGELLAHPPAGYRVRPVYATPGQPYRYTDKFNPGSASASGGNETPVAAGSGDIFLGLDLSAHLFPEAEYQLQNFRAAGARVHFVIYDLIPLRHPEYCDEGLTQAFHRWMHSLARQADGLHCISAAVAEDVRAWLYHNASTLPLPVVSHFHLGAEFDSGSPTLGLPEGAEQVLQQLAAAEDGKTFLTVSTIEPRKGQVQTLDAFELLWQQGLPHRLVLVGKAGWKVDAFIQRLRNHAELGKRLFWLEGISDEYLERVYRAVSCLIAASATEGFGLPLIEAAQRQLPVIARDIAVFREVAGPHAWYFAGEAPAELAQAIQAWVALEQKGQAPASTGMPYLNWGQSVQALLATTLPP